jgi:hypothetical protein
MHLPIRLSESRHAVLKSPLYHSTFATAISLGPRIMMLLTVFSFLRNT